jgi:hypothetical protein
MDDLTLRELQTKLPWTVKYSRDFRSNPQSHKDLTHGIVHAIKAAGRIMEFVDDYDHRMESDLEIDKYVADLVICALRIANTHPNRIIDLQTAVQERLEIKNNVKL